MKLNQFNFGKIPVIASSVLYNSGTSNLKKKIDVQ